MEVNIISNTHFDFVAKKKMKEMQGVGLEASEDEQIDDKVDAFRITYLKLMKNNIGRI
jgi:hypothetical protein